VQAEEERQGRSQVVASYGAEQGISVYFKGIVPRDWGGLLMIPIQK
jgi:hypothetical protein